MSIILYLYPHRCLKLFRISNWGIKLTSHPVLQQVRNLIISLDFLKGFLGIRDQHLLEIIRKKQESMLISHKHKFIFIKTEKTAGTSIEIALSKYCGLDDVITPIGPKGELKRKELGGRGPQNCKIPFKKYSKIDFLRAVYRRKLISFYNHASASYIMEHIDREIWDSYFKFCFERNPWDKALSWYYWRHKTEPRPSITEFIQSREANTVKGFELYSCSSEVVVDRVFKYEHLEQSMGEIAERIGLKEIPSLPRLKADTRKNKCGYRDVLTAKDRDRISKVFAREIAYFDYEW